MGTKEAYTFKGHQKTSNLFLSFPGQMERLNGLFRVSRCLFSGRSKARKRTSKIPSFSPSPNSQFSLETSILGKKKYDQNLHLTEHLLRRLLRMGRLHILSYCDQGIGQALRSTQ